MENKPKLDPSEVEKEKLKSKCPICKNDATLVCGGCQSVSYCCADHQKKHWKLHQSSCVFFHIKDDPSEFTGAGKCCVASRDLKAGTVILEELPIFQMPSNDLDRCITCGIELPPKSGRNASNSCPKCNWPVCGTACAEVEVNNVSHIQDHIFFSMLQLHAANECHVFVASGILYPKVVPDSSLSKLQLAAFPPSVRSIAFAIQNADRWQELSEMMNWEDIGSRSLDDAMDNTLVLDALKIASSHFPNITPLRGDHILMIGVLQKLTQLIITQGYKIWIMEVSAKPVPRTFLTKVFDIRHRIASYMYKTARHFVHSCSPNCFWTVGTFPDFKMQIRTSVAVKEGEKLTVSRFIYGVEFANGTRSRQKEFQTRFKSPCRCHLCLDPTEFGTYQSAVVCELCKTDSNLGFLLPIDPLNIADDASWKCNKCRKITIASKFCDKLEDIFRNLLENCTTNIASEDKVRSFIEMNRNKLVHPNHWIIQLAGKLIQTRQHPRIHSMNMEEVSGFEKLMHFLLDIKDKTFPGIIHERSLVVYSLSKAIWRRLLNPILTPCLQEGFHKQLLSKSREDILPILVEVEKCEHYQKEALLYYKHPPNIGRRQTRDHYLSALQYEMKRLEDFNTTLFSRLTQIEIQRLSLGIN